MPFALADISFTAAPGQLVALVGPFQRQDHLHLPRIPRLYDVDAGSVSPIGGVDVRGIRLLLLGNVIGFVTQETYLFHDTILANLALCEARRHDGTDRGGSRAPQRSTSGCWSCPTGYDTVVGERGYRASRAGSSAWPSPACC